jgi:integrase
MKRRHLTDQQIRKLPRKTKRYTLADPELIGHYLRVPPRTSKAPITFVVVVRREGRQVWTTVGTADSMTLDQARDGARRIRSGKAAGATVASIAKGWLQRRAKGLRTIRERQRIVDMYIVPHVGDRAMADVRRDDISHMLDRIEDENGPAMADAVLKVFSAIARWHHQRDEGYLPPLTKGMLRVKERRRRRILTDDEIKAIWGCGGGSYGALVRLALVVAQRREKVRTLRWAEVKDGIWTIRTEEREKGNAGQLRLPRLALDTIAGQPRLNEYVFPGRGDGPIGVAGHRKAEFDKLCGVKDWRFHDLRRTARSLMSRAGVSTEIAERVLGHTQGELIEIYDRHSYADEMAAALEKLAALIERIVPGMRGIE